MSLKIGHEVELNEIYLRMKQSTSFKPRGRGVIEELVYLKGEVLARVRFENRKNRECYSTKWLKHSEKEAS